MHAPKGFVCLEVQETIVGPPKKLNWQARAKREEHSLSEEAKTLLWECSEKATGQAFFG
jgi:hypothetical protein